MTAAAPFATPIRDPGQALIDSITEAIGKAFPQLAPDDTWTAEFRIRHTDGVWRTCTPREAVFAHQRGVEVQTRRVTGWVAEPNPNQPKRSN